MISIPPPAIMPKRKAAKRATVICASNIIIAVVKHSSCDLDITTGDHGMFSTIISQTSCPLPCSIALALVHFDEVDLLDRFEAQVLAPNLACDQDDGRAVPIGLVKPVDKVKTAGTARACAGGEAAGKLSFGARRKSSGLFVPHMDPLDRATVDGVSDPVQGVANDPVAPLHTGSLQRFDQYVRYAFADCGPSLSDWSGLITDEPHGDLKKEG
jgi:hypothetical protein